MHEVNFILFAFHAGSKLPNIQIARMDKWQNDNFALSSISPKKNEYAKLAITLTDSKGQALQVFEKISTPALRFG